MNISDKFEDSTAFVKILNKLDANVVNGDDFKGLKGKYVRLSPRTHDVNEKFIDILEKLSNRFKQLPQSQ